MYINSYKLTNFSSFKKIKNIFHKSSKKEIVSSIKSNKSIKKDENDFRIAYILSGFPTLSQTFVLNELRYLVKNGYDVKVFAYRDPMDPVNLDFNLEVIRFDKSEDLMSNLENLLIDYKIDLVHTHFVYPPCTNFTFPVCEKLHIPFTVFAHAVDIFVKEIDEKNRVGEIGQSKYCKGIFTLGDYHKNYLIERGVPEDKIVITKQATDYDIFPLKKTNNKIKKIVSISRFVEKKGINVLIDAAKLLENEEVEFGIYGFGDLEDSYKNQIQSLNIKNIEVKGVLNGPREVKDLFDNSDLLVSPCVIASNGDRDGFPTVIFESMAYGVPVITTNVSVIPEVIKDGKNGFIVPSNNPNELALKIKEVMGYDDEELFKIRQQAQIDVQNTSSVEKTMNILIGIWKD